MVTAFCKLEKSYHIRIDAYSCLMSIHFFKKPVNFRGWRNHFKSGRSRFRTPDLSVFFNKKAQNYRARATPITQRKRDLAQILVIEGEWESGV